jgi:Bacterial Ig-like domain
MRMVGLWLVLAGCYDLPKPVCGFRCGPSAACPARFTCAADGFCHADGTSQSCPVIDAAPEPIDRAPSLQQIIPAHDALDVSIETRVVATFTEAVLDVSASTFTLFPSDDTAHPVSALVTYDPVTNTARLIPDARLRWGTVYVAALGDAITDVRGHALDGPRSWSFTTQRDSEGPKLLSMTPPPGTTGLSVSPVLVLTFDEAVHFPFGAVLLATGGTSVGISPNAFAVPTLVFEPKNLVPYATYTLTLTNFVVDLFGNPLVNAPVITSFTTGPDTVVPAIVSVTPPDGGLVAPSTKPSVRFSEPVSGVSATSMTLATDTTSVPATVTYDATTLSARLTPLAPLAPGTGYTLRLSAAIEDAYGNALAPFTSSFLTNP